MTAQEHWVRHSVSFYGADERATAILESYGEIDDRYTSAEHTNVYMNLSRDPEEAIESLARVVISIRARGGQCTNASAAGAIEEANMDAVAKKIERLLTPEHV